MKLVAGQVFGAVVQVTTQDACMPCYSALGRHDILILMHVPADVTPVSQWMPSCIDLLALGLA